jgi:hypothetical protein
MTKGRLGELWHATEGQPSHWLHRVNEEFRLANHLFVEDMHRLGDEALALLRSFGIIPVQDWVLNSRIGGHRHTSSRLFRLTHDHMISDIMIDIEIGARKGGLPFRTHLQILTASPERTRAMKRPLKIPVSLDQRQTFVEPDAIFAIGNRYYALEADRGTESIAAVIVPKIIAYRELVAAHVIDDHFGIDSLQVLFATTSAKRMQHIMEELKRIAANGRSAMFAFRAEEDFREFPKRTPPSGRLMRAPWSRVGWDDLVLAGSNAS